MKLEGSLSCPQEPSTGPYPEPDGLGPYHHGMVRPQVADGIDCLQIRRVAANTSILNMQSQTADKGRSSSLRVERGANNPLP
jgi:hypothetical protein